jgi:hypothetical protein
MQQVMDKAARIAALNDRFRQTFWGGKVMMTKGVQELPDEMQAKLFRAVSEFNDFTEDNDSHREHDFGRIMFGSCTFFWKIDLHEELPVKRFNDNSSEPVFTRVLTIMLASEY